MCVCVADLRERGALAARAARARRPEHRVHARRQQSARPTHAHTHTHSHTHTHTHTHVNTELRT